MKHVKDIGMGLVYAVGFALFAFIAFVGGGLTIGMFTGLVIIGAETMMNKADHTLTFIQPVIEHTPLPTVGE